MEIGKPFNQLTASELRHLIAQHDRYTDFNTLGLYRSLLENERFDTPTRIELRELANQYFGKTYHFLQLRDPYTYLRLSTLGQELTLADERQAWQNIRREQQRILSQKRIRHRNFGEYGKHSCGYDQCPFNGLMIRQGSWFAAAHMRFVSDKDENAARHRHRMARSERRRSKTHDWTSEE